MSFSCFHSVFILWFAYCVNPYEGRFFKVFYRTFSEAVVRSMGSMIAVFG